MRPARVVLTGATGFIGSHIAEELVAQGYEVVALRRRQSDPWRVSTVAAHLIWVDIDDDDWEAQLAQLELNVLVHSAWLGVKASQRDDWQSQLTNLTFTLRLLQVLARGPLKKVIVLGSQAEYGAFEGRIDEQYHANPTLAYGAVKLATLDLVRAFCQAHKLDWYWLRVFAVFGPREDSHWFVSFVAASFLRGEAPPLTGCEQRYDYLFVKDLARAIVQTLSATPGLSGIYNIGADHATGLRNIVDSLRVLTGSLENAQYGAIPYRPGQVMHMEGDSSKFAYTFGPIVQTPLPTALAATLTFIESAS